MSDANLFSRADLNAVARIRRELTDWINERGGKYTADYLALALDKAQARRGLHVGTLAVLRALVAGIQGPHGPETLADTSPELALAHLAGVALNNGCTPAGNLQDKAAGWSATLRDILNAYWARQEALFQ